MNEKNIKEQEQPVNQEDGNGIIRRGKTIVKVSQSALELLNKNPDMFWGDCEVVDQRAFEGLDFSRVKVNYAYENKRKHFRMLKSGFYPNAQLKIPASVKLIGTGAFANCKGLESVQILAGDIQKQSFSNCKDLEVVFMGNDPVNFEEGVFVGTPLKNYSANFSRAVGGFAQEFKCYASEEFSSVVAGVVSYQGFNETSEMSQELLHLKTEDMQETKAGNDMDSLFNSSSEKGKGKSLQDLIEKD